MSTYWNKTLTSERTIQKEAIATDSDSINSHEKKKTKKQTNFIGSNRP